MINKEKVRNIAKQLLEKSRKGQVRWVEERIPSVDSYRVRIADTSIHLLFISPRVDFDRYEFKIANSTGHTVGQLIAVDTEENLAPDLKLLRDCFDEATRAVHHWDETINTIEMALSKDKPIGEVEAAF